MMRMAVMVATQMMRMATIEQPQKRFHFTFSSALLWQRWCGLLLRLLLFRLNCCGGGGLFGNCRGKRCVRQ